MLPNIVNAPTASQCFESWTNPPRTKTPGQEPSPNPNRNPGNKLFVGVSIQGDLPGHPVHCFAGGGHNISRLAASVREKSIMRGWHVWREKNFWESKNRKNRTTCNSCQGSDLTEISPFLSTDLYRYASKPYAAGTTLLKLQPLEREKSEVERRREQRWRRFAWLALWRMDTAGRHTHCDN